MMMKAERMRGSSTQERQPFDIAMAMCAGYRDKFAIITLQN